MPGSSLVVPGPGFKGNGGKQVEQEQIRVEKISVVSQTLEPAQHTNVYLVGHSGEAILVDAGFSDEEQGLGAIAAAWRAMGKPTIKGIFVTHGHHDHSRGLAALSQRFAAPVYAHAQERERILAENPGLQVEPVQDGDKFTVGGADMVVLATPGHTPGHLSFWFPGSGLLLCGDTMAGEGTVWVGPPDGNMLDYLNSLRRIAELRPRRIGAGHGPWIEDPLPAINELMEHRLMRERQIIDLLREGPHTSLQLARKIYEGQITERILPFAEKTVIAHLDKLLAEGRVSVQLDAQDGKVYRIG